MALFSDEQLAQGIQHGRADDLALLVERHHGPLLGFLYQMTGGDRALAEDLVQETFLHLLSKIDSYCYPRPLKPWLYAIGANLARDHYKQAEFRHTDSMPTQFEISVTSTPETELANNEETQQVVVAMNNLPLIQREVILLRYFHELSLDEISEIVQAPIGTVKSRLSMGLQRLKERLTAER
jgi:RNA polymerase sigma-70 factor, ECF subfamily